MPEYTFTDYRNTLFAFASDVRKALAASLPIEEWPASAGTAPSCSLRFVINGIDFSMGHDFDHRPDLFNLDCRYGALPTGHDLAAMSKVLVMTAEIAPIGRQCFCVDAADDLVFSESLSIRETGAADLLLRMKARAALVASWRSGIGWK
ncbi:hypothetical protein VARIO8X_90337 [Burkholderiales bacterium 8X]|nr:hypothetical protein VARIO8X_90337 [Burkholderiales bacterium 8X]